MAGDTIRVRVLYFGQAREAAGAREEEMAVPRGSSVGALRRSVESRRHISATSGALRVALNEEMAGEDDLLEDGDVVALLPPVAGG